MTNIYEVTVEQTITRTFEVEASSAEEASDIALDEHEDYGIDDESTSVTNLDLIDEEHCGTCEETLDLCEECEDCPDHCVCDEDEDEDGDEDEEDEDE